MQVDVVPPFDAFTLKAVVGEGDGDFKRILESLEGLKTVPGSLTVTDGILLL